MSSSSKTKNVGAAGFDSRILDKTIIALPLIEILKKTKAPVDVIIDLNLNYSGGREEAQKRVIDLIERQEMANKNRSVVKHNKTELSTQYVFARISGEQILNLLAADGETERAIYRIWPDFDMGAQTFKSVSTIKADAARSSFSAMGENIVWAVADSGIDFTHPHFVLHENKHQKYHIDLVDDLDPFADAFGHGTHVAGIIAGEIDLSKPKPAVKKINAFVSTKTDIGNVSFDKIKLDKISGIAPKCKLVSIKVLDDQGNGQASSLIAAIGHIQKINNYGRDIKIHGLNLSLGYAFDPEWFACGQSPLCVEVNRLVKSGVVVVAAAGNSGYGFVSTKFKDRMAMGLSLSINDPGNAELAITVGSTHRDMPHTFGVSYFSSKGPTGDGRLKPDLVAPGEKIISCAAGSKKQDHILEGAIDDHFYYLQESGTSMAAPHVSGAIAAFLSIRREYIGQPEKVKDIFNGTATDLKRDRYFQGNGMLDLMRAIQSI